MVTLTVGLTAAAAEGVPAAATVEAIRPVSVSLESSAHASNASMVWRFGTDCRSLPGFRGAAEELKVATYASGVSLKMPGSREVVQRFDSIEAPPLESREFQHAEIEVSRCVAGAVLLASGGPIWTSGANDTWVLDAVASSTVELLGNRARSTGASPTDDPTTMVVETPAFSAIAAGNDAWQGDSGLLLAANVTLVVRSGGEVHEFQTGGLGTAGQLGVSVGRLALVSSASGIRWTAAPNGHEPMSAVLVANEFSGGADKFSLDAGDFDVNVPNASVSMENSRLVVSGLLHVNMAVKPDEPRSLSVTIGGHADSLATSEGVVRLGSGTLATASAMGLAVAAVLWFLSRRLPLAGALLYTKLRKPQLLDHQRRSFLHGLIVDRPGISFQDLHDRFQKEFGSAGKLSFGSVTYHLQQLERFGLVVSKREGKYRRYFEQGASFGRDNVKIALLQTPPIPEVVKVLLRSPGSNQAEIHRRVALRSPLTRQTVGYHLKRLTERELVEVQRDGRSKRYLPTGKLKELLQYC